MNRFLALIDLHPEEKEDVINRFLACIFRRNSYITTQTTDTDTVLAKCCFLWDKFSKTFPRNLISSLGNYPPTSTGGGGQDQSMKQLIIPVICRWAICALTPTEPYRRAVQEVARQLHIFIIHHSPQPSPGTQILRGYVTSPQTHDSLHSHLNIIIMHQDQTSEPSSSLVLSRNPPH